LDKKRLGNCKVCMKEIAKNAPVCPHCGARLKMHLSMASINSCCYYNHFSSVLPLVQHDAGKIKVLVLHTPPQSRAGNSQFS
jgi:predicted amidophosphoribosyltransferase